MVNLMYKVYYTLPNDGNQARAEDFGSADMGAALIRSQVLRNAGATFVTMVCENANQVGAMGVDAVKDGKLPSGEDYTWKKRR